MAKILKRTDTVTTRYDGSEHFVTVLVLDRPVVRWLSRQWKQTRTVRISTVHLGRGLWETMAFPKGRRFGVEADRFDYQNMDGQPYPDAHRDMHEAMVRRMAKGCRSEYCR